ncbi:ILV2 [Symbiodinium sp. CCMP2456]|nr:ILV2 [Symbiodinium sp. CCMP2456]
MLPGTLWRRVLQLLLLPRLIETKDGSFEVDLGNSGARRLQSAPAHSRLPSFSQDAESLRKEAQVKFRTAEEVAGLSKMQSDAADLRLAGDPRNVPGPEWPAQTQEESNEAWPTGHQPASLAAWSVKHGKLSMCWQSKVLRDVEHGWPGQCVGLLFVQATTLTTCRNSCLNDPRCSVWQFNPGQMNGGCWQGQGHHCESRNGYNPVQFSGGQRIQHGSIRVMKQMSGIEVHGLRPIGKLYSDDQSTNIERCRNVCYSDILCQYWQYGEDGCRVEDPTYSSVQYPLTLEGGASKTSEYARRILAGEYIQHLCPPRSQPEFRAALRKDHPDPLGEYAAWRLVPYGILLALVILTLFCLAFCIIDYQDLADEEPMTGVGARMTSSRSRKDANRRGADSSLARQSHSPSSKTAQAPLPLQLASLPQRIFSPPQQATFGFSPANVPVAGIRPGPKVQFKECPATEITRSCTKWNYVCLDFNQLPWAVNEAFRIASSGRPGPCHIDLPKDIVSMKAQVPEAIFKKAATLTADAPPMLDMGAVQKAAELINKAKRPILYVGQGASHCPEILTQLAKKANIPVTTTCHAMGIFDEREPLSMHMLGMHGAAYANFAIQNADCIIAVGSRFDDRTTGIVAKYAPKAKAAEKDGTGGIIHINIDKSSFGKVVQPTVAVWADTEHALQALEPLVSAGDREDWLKQCQAWKEQHAFDYVKAPAGKIKVQQVLSELNSYLHRQDVYSKKNVFVATGVGNHQMMSCQFLRWIKPRSFITSGSLGVMGAGLPFAIGTQVANPDSLTILIDGDGSFGMTNMDLQTVKRYNLPIKMAVMNDDRQQMVWVWQRLFFEGRYISVTNDNPDFVALAKAYGIHAVQCDNEEDLPKVIEEWMSHDGPMLVDFKVVPDICLPMVAPGKALDEMILLPDRDAVLGTEEELGSMKFEGLAPS